MSAHEPESAEPEPKTPVWLTVLGACLLLALAFWWLSPQREVPDATIRVPAPTIVAPPSGGAPAAPPSATPTAARGAPPVRTAPPRPSGE